MRRDRDITVRATKTYCDGNKQHPPEFTRAKALGNEKDIHSCAKCNEDQ